MPVGFCTDLCFLELIGVTTVILVTGTVLKTSVWKLISYSLLISSSSVRSGWLLLIPKDFGLVSPPLDITNKSTVLVVQSR